MNIATFFKKHCFGIAICQGKQEIFDVPGQMTKKSFWGIMFLKTDTPRSVESFPQQQKQTLPENREPHEFNQR